LNDVYSFGANGVLGVGLFINDCVTGAPCLASYGPAYFTCTAGACTGSDAPANAQVANPVASFAKDNNGVILEMPALAPATGAMDMGGSLVFGINTQTNNQTSNQSVYLANGTANLNSTLTALTTATQYTIPSKTTYANSFIDSGFNGLYLPGTTIPTDAYGWFNPTSPAILALTATIQGAGAVGPLTPISFDIASADTVLFNSNGGANNVFNSLGAPSGGAGTVVGGIDWGFHFFLGKNVYVAVESASLTIGGAPYAGPFWAF